MQQKIICTDLDLAEPESLKQLQSCHHAAWSWNAIHTCAFFERTLSSHVHINFNFPVDPLDKEVYNNII